MTRYGDLAEHGMLGPTLWSLIRSRCLVRDECYRLPSGYARMSDQPSAANRSAHAVPKPSSPRPM
jgi:hypothetical protein